MKKKKGKFSSALPYMFCFIMGILSFICLAMPYLYYEHSWDNGYLVMILLNDGGFGCVMSALTLIVLFVLSSLMFIYGIFGFLKELGVFSRLSDKLFKKKLAKGALYLYLALNVHLLFFLIILCALDEYGEVTDMGEGIFVTLYLAISVVVLEKITSAKFAKKEAQESADGNTQSNEFQYATQPIPQPQAYAQPQPQTIPQPGPAPQPAHVPENTAEPNERIFFCVKCGTPCSVPAGLGPIIITCPTCSNQFGVTS